ncbi:hypothetical protein N7520_004163 [Penicillium odoratum]|uniref:uncharacterized protein n=1 Tax=Penicillium odoratum TaxID=1167516 RepID=UPI0025485B2B|nr:uncharacterized protein N7520_004163 [Penicillium odoratum]KAJ5769604.1 hypothetical protein N7520_004163 [Penicillium odoratum]
MSSIKDLLNPSPSTRLHLVPEPAREKKTKTPKDGAIFRPGKPQGEVRYPPCEERDEALLQIHREFRLYPLGNIADYPRHIPYNSQKKDFHEKTGRDSFNTFHYVFQKPGDDVKWMVMWDYNIGLVRITHLFKCTGYTKTAPGKLMAYNDGLRGISHSITGGALAAQGYWMPYEAARAVAATFCWDIRHVLTPLFGTDFPSICTPTVSGKARDFPNIKLDSSIIFNATQTAMNYRQLEKDQESSSDVTQSPGSGSGSTNLNVSTVDYIPYRQAHAKVARHNYADSVSSTRDSSSEPSYCHSPGSTVNNFTPVNAPRKWDNIPRSSAPSSEGLIGYRKRRTHHTFVRTPEPTTASMLVDLGSRIESQYWNKQRQKTSNVTGDTTVDELTDCEWESSLDNSLADTDEDEEFESDDGDDENEEYQASKRVHRRRKIIKRAAGVKRPDRNSMANSRVGCEVRAARALLRLHMVRLNQKDSDDEPTSAQREKKRRRSL